MYVYKIVITTLLILEMVSFVFSGLKCAGNGKVACMVLFLLSGMAIVAIWG